MTSKTFFLKINAITLGSVLALILVGSIVRSLGAGMGCPDWPKCFGSYVPPTTSEGLPDNYVEIFRDQRIKKNVRLSRVLTGLGYKELADKVANDPSVFQKHEFDVTKAWIEYVNRLVGVLIGFFVILNMIASMAFWNTKKLITTISIFIFLLTCFQGWIGSLVVSTNLLHGFITFHLILALLMVALLIWTRWMAQEKEKFHEPKMFWVSIALLLLLIPQILTGTGIRGIIDDLIASEKSRSVWVDSLQVGLFYVHRSYSWLLLAGSSWLIYQCKKENYLTIKKTVTSLFFLVLLTMLAGIGMVKLSFPFWMQSMHLILATGIFSLFFYLTLHFKFAK